MAERVNRAYRRLFRGMVDTSALEEWEPDTRISTRVERTDCSTTAATGAAIGGTAGAVAGGLVGTVAGIGVGVAASAMTLGLLLYWLPNFAVYGAYGCSCHCLFAAFRTHF
jgi:hypothetical protein